jgi:hypothetical protein
MKSASVAHYSLSALETVDFWAWFTHYLRERLQRISISGPARVGASVSACQCVPVRAHS